MKKLLSLLVFAGIILGLYFLTPARHYLSQDGFAQLERWIHSLGLWAPVVFGLIYVLACVAALPGSALTIGGGLLFGPWWGTLINWIAATIGALASFLIARYLGRTTVNRLLRNRSALTSLDDKLAGNAFYSVLFMRFVPLFPFNGLNYGLGLTKVSLRDYGWATAIGMLPATFVYTSLGAAGRRVNLTDPHTWADYHVWGPFVLVILLSLLPRLFRRAKKEPV